MNKHVSGFLYESDDVTNDPLHSHTLFITNWDGRQVHVHEFSGQTSFDVGHSHQYAARTEPAPNGVQHTHRYYTVTSLDDGHAHEIQGVTGPAIPIQGGGHFHYFEGVTTVNGATPHRHSYSGRTGNVIANTRN